MYADPKLKDAFVKAIKHYFDDNDLEEYSKVAPDRKFTKKYFDGLESELTGEPSEEGENPPKKKKKATPSNKSNSLRVK